MTNIKNAKWIWCRHQDVFGYNQTACFRKEFELTAVEGAQLRITADSRYRVLLNGVWMNDGPGRAYPEHWTYDVYDVSDQLQKGRNRIDVTVRYYGTGTFHQIPQQAGLLAELDAGGVLIGTDSSWLAAPLTALEQWSPKVCCQMEPVESVDARLASSLDWQPAVELFAAEEGPWKNLSPRRTAPLTKNRTSAQTVFSQLLVKPAEQKVCVPVSLLVWPGLIDANQTVLHPLILAAVLTLQDGRLIDFSSNDWKVSVNGRSVEGPVELAAGRYAVLFFCVGPYSHRRELPFQFVSVPGTEWSRWQAAVCEEFKFRDNDLLWNWFPNEAAERAQRAWLGETRRLSNAWKSSDQNVPNLGKEVRLPPEKLFMADVHADFTAREPVGSAEIEHAAAVCSGGTGAAVIRPVSGREVELCYDLGVQRCGYFDLEIDAPPGVCIDLHMVEYIRPDGVVQHTENSRNGMRYVTSEGLNRYQSLKRRSGRFLFVTFRGLTGPVTLKKLDLIESMADVAPVAPFRCSDENLNRIWEICERTLKLDMEDVFTDCPLYEQTLWTGDARNEALYAFYTYGDGSVSERSLELGAQSLERFPMVGSQVPSGWECLIPAWSFLWGMHVWEHFFYSGNLDFLRQLWPAVLKNLTGALGMLDEHGLFSGTFWNMIDWAPVDHRHPTVLHNSILLAGALRDAQKCAEALDDHTSSEWLQQRRKQLVNSINRWWDDARQSYPDAILEDGSASPAVSQHTSFLAVMCGVLPEGKTETARKNLLNPPQQMTRIGSPFASQFLFEALDLLDEPQAVLQTIRENYLPMLEAGATTVWEAFPGSTTSPDGFPTRSHCHAWAGGPLQFISRIVLGIRQTSPGGNAFEISPWVCGLTSASGAMGTPKGPVRVQWEISAQGLRIIIVAPEGANIEFKPNASHMGLTVILNGNELSGPHKVGHVGYRSSYKIVTPKRKE